MNQSQFSEFMGQLANGTICKEHTELARTLYNQTNTNILICFVFNGEIFGASTIDFVYDYSETKIIGIHVYTLCATRDDSYEETTGVGSQMMKIIKEVGRRVNAEFIKLNPTPESKPFYDKHGFVYDQPNNVSQFNL
jgi:hypothetical protein